MRKDINKWLTCVENGQNITYEQAQYIRNDFLELEKEIERRKEQLSDIAQFAKLSINNPKLSDRVVRSLLISIENRTTD